MVITRKTPAPADPAEHISPQTAENLLNKPSTSTSAQRASSPTPSEGRRRQPSGSPVADPPTANRQKRARKKILTPPDASSNAPLGSDALSPNNASSNINSNPDANLTPAAQSLLKSIHNNTPRPANRTGSLPGPADGPPSNAAGSVDGPPSNAAGSAAGSSTLAPGSITGSTSSNAPSGSGTIIANSGLIRPGSNPAPTDPAPGPALPSTARRVIDVDSLPDNDLTRASHASRLSVNDIINQPNFREALRITLEAHQGTTTNSANRTTFTPASIPAVNRAFPPATTRFPQASTPIGPPQGSGSASTSQSSAGMASSSHQAAMPSIAVQSSFHSASSQVPVPAIPLLGSTNSLSSHQASTPTTSQLASMPINLHPLPQRVPIQGLIAPPIQASTASSSAPSIYTQMLPPSAFNVKLDANAVSDHPLVARALREGWSVHIPLTVLTNEKCQLALFVDNLGSKRDPDKNPLVFETSSEPNITLADFMEAWPRLCRMIKSHLNSPDSNLIGDAFFNHFQYITSRIDFHKKFPLYVEYDIYIRMHWVAQPGSFNPADFQDGIWNSIQDSHRDRILADARRAPQGPYTSSSRRSGIPPQRGSSNSFRGRGISTNRQGRCYVCGSSAHAGRFCPNESNGFLSKSAEGWKGPGNSSICFRFNGINNICNTDNCTYSHVCSRCGDSGHSAQSHPST